MKKTSFNHFTKGQKGIVLVSISLFALFCAYLTGKGRRKSRLATFPKVFNQNELTMERYVFNLPQDGDHIQAVVEQGGECYAVHLNGSYVGCMSQEEHDGGHWRTDDEKLKPYLQQIAQQLSEAFSRKGFSSLLMGTYPQITSTEWKTGETLEVKISSDADLEVFTTFLKDEVLNLVTFEEHLDLMVKKENEDYFVLIGIN